MCFRRQMSHQLLSPHIDQTYAVKERSPKNPACCSHMDWNDDEFTDYRLPIDENNLYPVEAFCSDMDWSDDKFADCRLLIGADKLYPVEDTISTSPKAIEAQPILRKLLTAPMEDKNQTYITTQHRGQMVNTDHFETSRSPPYSQKGKISLQQGRQESPKFG